MSHHVGTAWRRALAATAAFGALAIGLACGTGGDADAPSPDPARDGDGGGGGDASGDALVDAKAGRPNLLVKGDILLIGVTRDGYVVYRRFDFVVGTYSLWAIALSGGEPIELSADLGGENFVGRVVNSAVAFWTGVGPDGLGTFNVWTKATGLKSAPGKRSYQYFFTAPQGGTTVLFGSGVSDGGLVDGSVANIDVDVAPLADLSAATTLKDVNIAAMGNNCPAQTFTPIDGNAIFLMHCTGTAPDAVVGRVTLARRLADGGVTSSVLLSESSAATATIPAFGYSIDPLGTKLFAIGAAPFGEGRVIDVATATSVVLDPNVRDGVMSQKGAGIVYVSNGSFKRASTDGGAKVTLVDGGVDHLRELSDDEQRVLFASTPGGLADLKLADTTTAGQTPTTLVADASAIYASASPTGDVVVYLSVDLAAQIADCNVVRADGTGARKIASDVAFCERMPRSKIVLVDVNPHLLGPFSVHDVQTLDLSDPAALPVPFEKDVTVLVDAYDGKVAFVRKGVESGLYARSLP